jgi:hypothetical protein
MRAVSLSACGSDEPSAEQSTPENGHPITSDTEPDSEATSLVSPSSSNGDRRRSRVTCSSTSSTSSTATTSRRHQRRSPSDRRLLRCTGSAARRAAGTLIWAEPVELGVDLNPPSLCWRILYHSRDSVDTTSPSRASSGAGCAAPSEDASRAGHGTVGVGDVRRPETISTTFRCTAGSRWSAVLLVADY